MSERRYAGDSATGQVVSWEKYGVEFLHGARAIGCDPVTGCPICAPVLHLIPPPEDDCPPPLIVEKQP